MVPVSTAVFRRGVSAARALTPIHMTSPKLADFIDKHLRVVEPLLRDVNLAYWNATISGRQADFDRFADLQVKLQRVYSNKRDFERLSAWRNSGELDDRFDVRQVELLYHDYLRNQIDRKLNERITKLGTKIENQFNVYRARLNNKTVTSNDLLKILKESTDSELRRKAWVAGKEVGAVVHDDLITLVKLRNEAAAALGFRDYYEMSLELNEQTEDDIVASFDELDRLTREPFEALKSELDDRLSERYRIATGDIRPWHYEDPFFQEAPQALSINIDTYFADRDILELVSRFYESIGLDVDDILGRSDLYEKQGKDQHAFCTDIDRKGDVRILANIKADETWTGTMLHELGHAVHDKYIDPDLPFLLRQEAHIFTTEAVAMMFGRLSKDPEWLQDAVGIDDEEKARIAPDLVRNQRLSQVIFARWSQVMMNFERGLYENPDQDLNKLWWDLALKYQLLASPDDTGPPYWAAKNHLVSAPVYYHNYLLGEILASQLTNYINASVLPAEEAGSFHGHPQVGEYLKQNVFYPGASYRWDEMIERATGEPLTPKYFAAQFVN